ncbi:MAG TPA: H-type lectin domain-containing protein, partial [Prosthecobacter sp.]
MSAFSLGLAAGSAQAAPANFESGAITTPVQNTGDQWNAVTFTRTFAVAPVVVMGPSTQANGEPLVVRVRNVTTTGFEYQLDEWDYINGYHPAETVHFFALTPGTHVFGTQRWQVGRVTGVNRTNTAVALSGFTAAPVVLGQVESTVNSSGVAGKGVKALKTRISGVTTTNFQVKVETQELDTAAISNESIGYIAVSTGTGFLDGKVLSAVRSTAAVTSTLATVTFPASRTNPVLIAQTQSANEADPGELRMASLGSTSV